eukprot:CAMPEP_0185832720 /NCGR_PEP_ID=MMETSP1353-20130828/2248_1 /TAXON_ID=1077150 /ORGANISM="Erythrolobus australicus, Strain CCMP3124" /LENGTH=69 /DNA_ID=CAMNT_0028530929 /DNA_START=120 /DNA_END=329 /DNA_ORIENTATION=+
MERRLSQPEPQDGGSAGSEEAARECETVGGSERLERTAESGDCGARSEASSIACLAEVTLAYGDVWLQP